MEKNKKRNKITIIFTIVGVLVIILGICFFAYKIVNLKENQEDNNTPEEVEKDKDYIIETTLKFDDSGYSLNCSNAIEGCITYKIKTKTTNAEVLSSAGYKDKYVFILYDDNGLKLYDAKEKKTQELNLKIDDAAKYNYELRLNQNKDDVIGIIYRNQNSNIEKYYSLKNQKVITNIISSMKYENLKYGFLYNNDGLVAYNIYTDTEQKLDLEPTYENYTLSFDSDKLYGIYYSKDKESGYYNVLTNKKMYENTYIKINGINENYLRASKIENIGECNGWDTYDYLLSATEEKVIFDEKLKNNICYNYYAMEQNGSTYLEVVKGFQAYPEIDLYTKDKKLIASNVKHYNLTFMKGNVYIINNNKLNKYDSSGILIESNKDYNNLLGFLDNELVYLDNNKLYLKNIETNNVIEYSNVNWNDNYVYEGDFSYVDKKENKKCLAISFKESIKENDKTYVGMESCYDTKTKTFTNKYTDGAFTNQIMD